MMGKKCSFSIPSDIPSGFLRCPCPEIAILRSLYCNRHKYISAFAQNQKLICIKSRAGDVKSTFSSCKSNSSCNSSFFDQLTFSLHQPTNGKILQTYSDKNSGKLEKILHKKRFPEAKSLFSTILLANPILAATHPSLTN